MTSTAAQLSDPLSVALSHEQTTALHQVISGLSSQQLIWSSGYLAGLAAVQANGLSELPLTQTAADAGEQLSIVYGSQTGNGQAVAEQLYQDTKAAGIRARIVSMADFKPRDIAKETWVALVVSTHGEGDAPDDAELLLEYLQSKRAPKLTGLSYFMLALGDSSYTQYCQSGDDFDVALTALGASRVTELTQCDVDYEGHAALWKAKTLEVVKQKLTSSVRLKPTIPLQIVETNAVHGKANPFGAEVLLNQKITGAESSKVVQHLELDLLGSGILYEPGDSLAVVTQNPLELVLEVIEATGFNSDVEIHSAGEALSLKDALISKLEVTANSGAFLQRYIELTGNKNLAALYADAAKKKVLLNDYQVVDVLRNWPVKDSELNPTAQNFSDTLRPLTPRVYSISSSLLATPDEVHITVAEVNYTAFGRPHWGSASNALTHSFSEGDRLKIYVEPNPRFRLPTDDSCDLIMIGPGTGVAPFRAFIEHRAARQAEGRNWLFFGDRNFKEDFLYQIEWQSHLNNGTLHKLDVAFSRDQKEKIYVQDRLLENSKEIWQWLENGASLYVCGDSSQMAPDVHLTLLQIIKLESGCNTDEAIEYLKALKQNQRYLRDVY